MRRINPADSLIVPGPTNEPTITMDVRLGKYFDLLDVNQEYAGTLLRAYSNATDIPPS